MNYNDDIKMNTHLKLSEITKVWNLYRKELKVREFSKSLLYLLIKK